jgi:hypothetical protein
MHGPSAVSAWVLKGGELLLLLLLLLSMAYTVHPAGSVAPWVGSRCLSYQPTDQKQLQLGTETLRVTMLSCALDISLNRWDLMRSQVYPWLH